MAYRGLTSAGANYLATRLAQELAVEFTKVQIGAGTPSGNPADVTALQNYKLDAKILKKSQENNTVEITIQVVNDNVSQGFYLKEIGVFVNDDTEKLYWYCNEDNAQYIPAKTDSAIAFEIDIKMEVTNVESPILNWSGQGTWVNKDYLEEVLKGYTVNSRKLIAGKGLTGGGDLIQDRTINVASANDGIIVNEDNVQLNPVTNLLDSSTTRALAANQGLILDNKDVGIIGGRNGKFPLTSATKGSIYLLESTQKYYICTTDYNGSQLTVPNANFEELSVFTNRSKLDNLFNNVAIPRIACSIVTGDNNTIRVKFPRRLNGFQFEGKIIITKDYAVGNYLGRAEINISLCTAGNNDSLILRNKHLVTFNSSPENYTLIEFNKTEDKNSIIIEITHLGNITTMGCFIEAYKLDNYILLEQRSKTFEQIDSVYKTTVIDEQYSYKF